MQAHPPLRLLVADLDGTLLCDGSSFETRALSARTISSLNRAHEAGIGIAVATARPVRTAWDIVHQIPVDACVYLNGALIDTSPQSSDYDMLTSQTQEGYDHLLRFGFPSSRAAEVCRNLVEAIPGLRVGVVMNDKRYTNFDIRMLWAHEECHITDFSTLPPGYADKIIIFPYPEQIQHLQAVLPPDFEPHVSEGIMWMLMNPKANKAHALKTLCTRQDVPLASVAAFGDDAIDISMMRMAGIGVAVSNAIPDVLNEADQICPSNNEDGVAQWIDAALEASR